MADIATETVEALFKASRSPSIHRNGKLELVLPDGTSALLYISPDALLNYGVVLVVQATREGWLDAYFAKPPKKGKTTYFDNWQPKKLGLPNGYAVKASPASIRPILAQLLEAMESNTPPLLPGEKIIKNIPAYKFRPAMIGIEQHKALPFKKTPDVNDGLDAIAEACERGMLHREEWVLQCFKTVAVFHEFMELLAEYDECFRIHDRWYQALMLIVNTDNEEGFVTSQEIAEQLVEAAIETGQIESE